MKCCATRLLLAIAATGLVRAAWMAPVQAQGSRADYERSATFARRTSDKVLRANVQPHWLPGGDALWYRVRTASDRYEFVLVDAAAGERRAAFNHDRLAEALADAAGQAVVADQLPFSAIEFDDSLTEIQFAAFGKSWRWRLDEESLWETDGDAEPSERAVGVEELARPWPGRSGGETSIVFINAGETEAELFWFDGERRQSYGLLAAGERRDQHTFAGHVWIVVGAKEQTLGIYRATEAAGRVEFDDDSRPRSSEGRDAERRERRRGEAVSPDGAWRAVIRDHNVVVESTESGESFVLSTNGVADDPYVSRFAWSPDSQRLVAVQEAVGEGREIHLIESSPDDQLQPKLHTLSYAKPGDRMPRARPKLFHVAERRQIDVSPTLFENPWSIEDIRWRPDSGEFTFVYNERGHQVLRVVAVDATTGRARAVIDEASETFIDYAHKQFAHYLDETGEIIWMSERDGWNHLYLYDATTGEVKNQITQGDWVVRGVERVDEVARQVWLQVGGVYPDQDPYYVHLARVNFDGSGLTLLTEADGTHAWEFSPDGDYFIDAWSRVDQPPVTELRRCDDGSLVCSLETGDWSALLATGWRPPERFVARGRDGQTDIHGLIFRPTNFEPGRKYPVVEHIYAGPHSAFVPKAFGAQSSYFATAELGFIVVKIDGMGTSHRSKAFHDVAARNIADAGFPDRIAWIKAAAAERLEMDLTRVGLYGGSAGGQNALRGLIAHGDFYHVGSADCGCHDNRMDKIWWNELWMGWPVGPHYEEQSNVTQAHRLQGELQLIVGELDRNVDPASTMQVVDALIKADKDFELVVVPGAGHGAAGTPYGRRKLQDFLVRKLLDVEPRWEGDGDSVDAPPPDVARGRSIGETVAAAKVAVHGPETSPVDSEFAGLVDFDFDALDDSADLVRAAIERFREDLGLLRRFYSLEASPTRCAALRSFLMQWSAFLHRLDFDSLAQDEQIDYLLLQNEISHALRSLDLTDLRNAEAAPLLPFAEAIVELHEARRRNESIDAREAADRLVSIGELVAAARASIEDGSLAAEPNQAIDAARTAGRLARALEEWHGFHADYSPLFTWWTAAPYEATAQALRGYQELLREKLGGVTSGDNDAIIGVPIGRDALLSELEYELIDYTPEELIEIGERELAWCRKELIAAAQELGYGDDWRAALDHVKKLHVPAGEQPRLIKQLAEEAVAFLDARDLLTVPELCRRSWRMEMMSPERQRVSPYFTGGEVISVSYPTAEMEHADKLMSMRGNNIHFSRATVQHELIPGHHLQGFMADRNRPHRKLFRTPFLVEGWALYWEMLLWDLEFPQSAEDRVGMLFWRTHRCARIIFSLKYHLGEMTAEEAVDFLVENVGHERRNAAAEVRRSVEGSYGPLYQAAYMLGGLQIRSLHETLVQSGSMTNREFHDAILRENSIPIKLIRASLTGESLRPDSVAPWRFYPALDE